MLISKATIDSLLAAMRDVCDEDKIRIESEDSLDFSGREQTTHTLIYTGERFEGCSIIFNETKGELWVGSAKSYFSNPDRSELYEKMEPALEFARKVQREKGRPSGKTLMNIWKIEG